MVLVTNRRDDITSEFVCRHNDKPWDWDSISSYSTFLTKDFIQCNEEYLSWNRMIHNPNVPFDVVLAYPDKKWNIRRIILNDASVTPEIIETFIDDVHWNDGPLDKYCLSTHPGVTLELLERFIDKPFWDWRYVSCNPNLTIDFIRRHPDKSWDWCDVEMLILYGPKRTEDFTLIKYRHAMWIHSEFLYDNLSGYLLRGTS